MQRRKEAKAQRDAGAIPRTRPSRPPRISPPPLAGGPGGGHYGSNGATTAANSRAGLRRAWHRAAYAMETTAPPARLRGGWGGTGQRGSAIPPPSSLVERTGAKKRRRNGMRERSHVPIPHARRASPPRWRGGRGGAMSGQCRAVWTPTRGATAKTLHVNAIRQPPPAAHTPPQCPRCGRPARGHGAVR